MAIGTTAAIGLGLGALGGYMDSRSKNKAAKQQNTFNQGMFRQAQGMMQNRPGAAENQLMRLMAQGGGGQMPGNFTPSQVSAPGFNPQMVDASSMLQQGGFNNGQDAIMQALRADPRTKVDQTLEGLAHGNGDPFDTSSMFQALGVIDRRNTENSVAATRAGAGSIGQRFGSAMANREGRMRGEADENTAARNAQIQMGSYENAMGRKMGALGQLSGREQFNQQFQLQGGGMLQQGGLAAAQAQMQGAGMNNAQMQFGAGQQMQAQLANQQAGMSAAQLNQQGQQFQQGNQMDQLRLLMQGEQGRQQYNAQLMGMAGGMGQPVAAPGYGGMVSGLGSLGIMAGMPRRTTMSSKMGRIR